MWPMLPDQLIASWCGQPFLSMEVLEGLYDKVEKIGYMVIIEQQAGLYHEHIKLQSIS